MPWLIIVLGYFPGSIPSAYIAGHILKGVDIRQVGDENMGAASAFLVYPATTGRLVAGYSLDYLSLTA